MGQLVGTQRHVSTRARRRTAGALLALAAWCLLAPGARADTQDDIDADGWVTDQGGGVSVGHEGGGPGGGGSTPGGASRPRSCRYYLQDSDAASVPGAIGVGDEVAIGEVRAHALVDTLVWRVCTWLDTAERGLPQLIIVPPNAGLVARAAAERAAAELVLPLPAPRTSPPGPTVVNIETWLWTDPLPAPSSSASVGGVTATVVGLPVRTIWRPGDGTEVTCRGAPTADEPCTHVYATRSGHLTASVTEVWRLAWTSTNGESGDLGEVARTTTFEVDVLELDVVLRER